MTENELRGSLSLKELMECARRRALLDDWNLKGDVVLLKVGTYEIELDHQDAERFVSSLLRNYEVALARAAD